MIAIIFVVFLVTYAVIVITSECVAVLADIFIIMPVAIVIMT